VEVAFSQQQFQITWAAMDVTARPTQPGNSPPLDFSGGHAVACEAQLLPWPASGIGCYTVLCKRCRRRVMVGTTGAPTDPPSVTVHCRATPDGVQYVPQGG
jgi:hypothetical protein